MSVNSAQAVSMGEWSFGHCDDVRFDCLVALVNVMAGSKSFPGDPWRGTLDAWQSIDLSKVYCLVRRSHWVYYFRMVDYGSI